MCWLTREALHTTTHAGLIRTLLTPCSG